MPGVVRFDYNNQKLVFIGGPYKERLNGTYGVKLAPEIDRPFDFEMGVKDFGTWDHATFENGLSKIIHVAQSGPVPYIGCFAGQGRTGTVIAGLCRVLNEDADPIAWTRTLYNSHAVETAAQRDLVHTFDAERVRAGMYQPRQRVIAPPTLLDRVRGWFTERF